MKNLKILFYVLVLLSATSCSIQKRHYMPGYSIESNSFTPQSKANDKVRLPDLPKTESELIQDTCDVLELKDSTKLRVKVLEIGITDVKYRICGTAKDSVINKSKSEITGIDFSNGDSGVFDDQGKLKPKKKEAPVKIKKEKVKKKANLKIDAKLSIIFGISSILLVLAAFALLYISVFLLGVAAVLFGLGIAVSINGIYRAIKVLREAKNNTVDKKYKRQAIIGLVSCVLPMLPLITAFVILVINILT